jgi:hypothetical protein
MEVKFKEELTAIEQCESLFPSYILHSVIDIATYRVQGSLGSRTDSFALQSPSTLNPKSNQVLHRRAAADGQVRSNDGLPDANHRR